MTTFAETFATQINNAVVTNNLALICKEITNALSQAKTFHQFHEAWLKLECYKYFQYSQCHSQNTFSVFIENTELTDDESANFGLNLYIMFGHDYKTLESNINRIDYDAVFNSNLDSSNLDLSKFNFA